MPLADYILINCRLRFSISIKCFLSISAYIKCLFLIPGIFIKCFYKETTRISHINSVAFFIKTESYRRQFIKIKTAEGIL